MQVQYHRLQFKFIKTNCKRILTLSAGLKVCRLLLRTAGSYDLIVVVASPQQQVLEVGLSLGRLKPRSEAPLYREAAINFFITL